MSRNRPGRRQRYQSGVRARVYDRDGWQCRMPACLSPDGRTLNPKLLGSFDDWAPSVDHVIPKSLGGKFLPGNLRASHRRCNIVRGAGKKVSLPLFLGDQGSAWS